LQESSPPAGDVGTGLGDRISATARHRIHASGVAGLTAEQGLSLFDAALGSAEPVLIPVRFAPAAAETPPAARDVVPTPVADRSWPARPSEPELRDLLRVEVAAVLGHPDPRAVTDDRPFPELGFDSLTNLEVRARIATLAGRDIPAAALFDHQTVAELAGYLHRGAS
jgi:acyl carrier protein